MPTLLDKVWDLHSVRRLPTGQTQIFIGLHLIHEVTTPQAFAMLRERGLRPAFPERIFGTMDHIIPTASLRRPTADPVAEAMISHPRGQLSRASHPALRSGRRASGHRPRDRSRDGPDAAGDDHRLRRQPHLHARRVRRAGLRHRHLAGARRAGLAVPGDGQAEAAPRPLRGPHGPGRHRQGSGARDDPAAGRERRRGLCLRVHRRRRRSHDHGRAHDALQPVDRRRRAHGLCQPGRHDVRVPPRPFARAHRRRLGPRGGVVAQSWRRTLARPPTTSA